MAPEPPAAPEAMSAAGLADLGAETDTEATILRLAPVNAGPAAPVAFLIHGGTVPVEVSRDVVIGRDPDARALTGRPVCDRAARAQPGHRDLCVRTAPS